MALPILTSTIKRNQSSDFPPGQPQEPIVLPKPSKTEDLFLRMAAGGSFGLFADSFTNLSLVIQTRKLASDAAKINSSGWLHTARMVISSEGLRGCYSGFPTVAAGSIMGTGAYCVGSHFTREYLGESDSANLLAGCGGQFAGSTCGWTTAAVLSEIQQSPKAIKDPSFENKRATEIAKLLLKKGGIRELYRGYWVQLANFGAVNAFGELFAGRLRKLAKDHTSIEELSVIQQAAINGLSWGTAAAISNPLGVLKLRVQLSGMDRQHFPDRSALKCAQRILKEEGVKGMYKGSSARVAAITPRAMIFFTGMPYVYRHLRKSCNFSD